MANKDHLAQIRRGVQHWNSWIITNVVLQPDLSGANFIGANLSEADLFRANLSNADFSGANLGSADLSKANLSGADLFEANLSSADLSGANLKRVDLSGADLSHADFNGADLSDADLTESNIFKADLSHANLSGAKLKRADLSNANLCEANLYEADLTGTQALKTNFTAAQLTGACLQDWNINSETQLDGVVCQYVYLRSYPSERCPHTSDFAPGEFTKLFQEVKNIIELTFDRGINWRAFAYAFKEVNLNLLDGGELFLREYKVLLDALLKLKLSLPPGAIADKIRGNLLRHYELQVAQLTGQGEAKDTLEVMERLFRPPV